MNERIPTLVILALIFSVLLWPVGLILAIIALYKCPKHTKWISITAVVICIVEIFLTFMLMVGPFSLLKNSDERCYIATPFSCTDFELKAVGAGTGDSATLKADIINKGSSIRFKDIDVECRPANVCNNLYACFDEDGDNSCKSEPGFNESNTTWSKNEKKTLLIDCEKGSTLNESAMFKLQLYYVPENSDTEINQHGEIFGYVN
ncbi:MAG: hypothetical protein ACOCQX_04270 [Candidatus Nanoarchaeia archaeon]